ncbi:MAG: polyprenyl synthetase family protein [Bacteroidales bacterium]|nr:polyprenyl synthetase family protein [Bacteroidales bacterium]
MYTLSECQSIVNEHINKMQLPVLPENLYDPMRYILNLEAKRIRPALVLMGCNLFSDDIEQAVFPALAIEVFHNFTLMHDDIMDHSERRRNNLTVHVKWNTNVAILSGDAMLIKAYELLNRVHRDALPEILPVFNQTALQVCEGQQYDMDYENRTEVTIEEYLKMITYKTAVLLAASLKMGALLGGSNEEDSNLLYEYGKNLGIAFQLQDDLLDVFADPDLFGKVTGNDIVTNKKTILLIEALRASSGAQREKLLHWLSLTNFDKDEKVKAVSSIYTELDIPNTVRERIDQYHRLAIGSLERLSKESVRKEALLSFAGYLLNRKK